MDGHSWSFLLHLAEGIRRGRADLQLLLTSKIMSTGSLLFLGAHTQFPPLHLQAPKTVPEIHIIALIKGDKVSKMQSKVAALFLLQPERAASASS